MDPTHNNPVSELGVVQTRKTPQNVSQCELENSLTNLVDRTKCKRSDLTGIIKGIVGIFGKYGTKGFGTFQDELEGNWERPPATHHHRCHRQEEQTWWMADWDRGTGTT